MRTNRLTGLMNFAHSAFIGPLGTVCSHWTTDWYFAIENE